MLPAITPAMAATKPSMAFHAIVKYSSFRPRRTTAARCNWTVSAPSAVYNADEPELAGDECQRPSLDKLAIKKEAKPYSVFRLGINSLQCLPRSLDEADHGTACEFRLRWRFCPDLFWFINCDVVPYDAPAIMLSHRMRENSIWVPVLFDPRILDTPQGDSRGCGQVRCQHRLPNYEHTQMSVCLYFQQ